MSSPGASTPADASTLGTLTRSEGIVVAATLERRGYVKKWGMQGYVEESGADTIIDCREWQRDHARAQGGGPLDRADVHGPPPREQPDEATALGAEGLGLGSTLVAHEFGRGEERRWGGLDDPCAQRLELVYQIMRAVDAILVGFRAGEVLESVRRELEQLRRRMEKLERSLLARQRTEAPQETCQAGLSHGEVPRAQCVRVRGTAQRRARAHPGVHAQAAGRGSGPQTARSPAADAWLWPSERWLLGQIPEEGPGVHAV